MAKALSLVKAPTGLPPPGGLFLAHVQHVFADENAPATHRENKCNFKTLPRDVVTYEHRLTIPTAKMHRAAVTIGGRMNPPHAGTSPSHPGAGFRPIYTLNASRSCGDRWRSFHHSREGG